MQIVLVRHGQSTNNLLYETSARASGEPVVGEPSDDGRSDGEPPGRGDGSAQVRWYRGRVPDPSLTELGFRQAAALGRALREGRTSFVPTHLYASPTVRAVQTARPLAEATGLPVVLRMDAYEVGGIHHYDLETRTRHARPGATLCELQEQCPALVAAADGWADADVPWDGGLETDVAQALPRAEKLLADLRATHGPGDVVVVVSHQYFSQFVIAALLGFAGPPWRRFRVDNTAHLAILVEDARTSVEWVNRSDHLDPVDVTN